MRLVTALMASLLLSEGTTAAPPLVVETDSLTPEKQRAEFVLPSGFQIELIASEPDIGQPMNLHFDAAGRLWVTHTVEYPYPVEGEGVEPRDERFGPNGNGPPRDRISIISGIGTEDIRVTHFAEGLNIPIGIVPLSTTSAIGFSIPNLFRWDGESRVQSPESSESTDHPQLSTLDSQLLFGPFGNVDTHGMVNGLTHWIDGWVYACHGFRNTSTIRDSSGHEITMNSGNTFRFQPDGSQIEQYTWGQVNPYGLTFDPWGNIYTADCHSKPLTCLIPGAYYSSFGKPHDGLGFGPDMIDHSHGSTGICGPCYYAAEHFPPEYRDCIYLCNPVTGIVHRDKLIWHGSTPQADTQPDFITCKDGWFRPVDIQLGPDGALYIADFYNCIIGHYEVPLDHPRRDRTHGRIWRVTYTNPASGRRQSRDRGASPAIPDLTKESLDELINRLGDPNLTVRVLASHHIVNQHGPAAIDRLREACLSGESNEQRVHALWILFRIGAEVDEELTQLLAVDSPLLHVHLARLIGRMEPARVLNSPHVTRLLRTDDPRVQRAIAENLTMHSGDMITWLIEKLPPPDAADTHLRHALRISLRDTVRPPEVLQSLTAGNFYSAEVASVCLGLPTKEAAAYLLNAQKRHGAEVNDAWVTHIARYGIDEDVSSLVAILQGRLGNDFDRQLAALKCMEAGQSLRRVPRNADFKRWATDVARNLLAQVPRQPKPWQNLPLRPGQTAVEWGIETRTATNGQPLRIWSSLPGGEQGVGIHHSPSFELPDELTFWIAGHDGFPQNDAAGKNFVRLVRDEDGHVLQSVPVPRHDPPTKVEWGFGPDVRQRVHIELVDGLDIAAYAWTAAGEFSIDSLNPPEYVPSTLAAELIGTLHLTELQPQIERLLEDRQTSAAAMHDLAAALQELNPDVRLQALLPWLERSPSSAIARRVREQLLRRDGPAIDALLKDAMRSASTGRQQAMAEMLAGQRDGARLLVDLVTAGHASPRLLRAATVLQKLAAISDDELRTRVTALLRDLPPEDERLAQLIHQRRAAFDPDAASIELGREVFIKSCAVCHQIGGEGNEVGPQLDGIGLRGIDRLLEDTLDPNRNVDAAFRSTTILTTDGRVLTGLLRREEGETLIFADSKGEEFRVAVDDIEERALSPLSQMPEDIAVKLPEGDLHDLLAFLLAQTRKVSGAEVSGK